LLVAPFREASIISGIPARDLFVMARSVFTKEDFTDYRYLEVES
jgi:hypothetical protein